MLDTFGHDTLSRGSGVLDVAGGKGELACELINLAGIPATVIEPRALQVAKCARRLLSGHFHWNLEFKRYNTRTLESVREEGVLPTPHVRMLLDPLVRRGGAGV